jgi:hypothetical protein
MPLDRMTVCVIFSTIISTISLLEKAGMEFSAVVRCQIYDADAPTPPPALPISG